MGKKAKYQNKKKGNQNNHRNRTFKIPEDVKEMSKLTIKKFKKDNDFYDTKKELKKAYYDRIVDLIPESTIFVIRYGHIDSNKEYKEGIYEKLTDPKVIKTLSKHIKDGNDVPNIELLPSIIYSIMRDAIKHQEAQKSEGNNVEFDLTDLNDLSRQILKKPIKKLVKKAKVDENVAFDILSVIPSHKILDRSPYHHIRLLFSTLYEHAKTHELDFGRIIKVIVKEKYVPGIITFALLERKEKVSSFSDKQKELFNNITEFCFKRLEDSDKETIRLVLNQYIQARQRDEHQNRDSNRRYYISSLPESDYPKILKVVKKMISEKEEVKKYL